MERKRGDNMKFFAEPIGGALFDQEHIKVSIMLWWPGRDLADYGDFEAMPEKFKSLVRRCISSGSRYLVYATVILPNGAEVYGYSRCMDIDNPERKYGINKAVGWLHKRLLNEFAWTIVREPALEAGA